ncbi:MAG: 2-C-methyl-D-erythritol 4-phosphate cytidylyltransferase [Nitrospirae bacterium]|nr:2-C-methyl-D-erythritol 4-phosphate cytidylyltransferase [Nitrospirota bacterium]
MIKKVIAIVPAAGLGKRFNASIKKTFADLNGVPLLVHTLKRLNSEKLISEVVPALSAEDIENGHEMVKAHNLSKIKRIAPGGKERQDSIYNALKLLERAGIDPGSIVLIHDGVRPFIPKGLIENLISDLENFDGVIPGIPVKDTLKEVSSDNVVVTTMNRENIRAIQTPQAFTFGVIKKAYDAAYAEGSYATDDAALVEKIGGRVKIVTGSPYNIKVTTPEDMEMAEWLMAKVNL